MKLSLKIVLPALMLTLFAGGCAKNVRVKAVDITGIGAMSGQKRVAIVEFKNDEYGLTSKIESKISEHELNEKKYFTVIGKKHMQKVVADHGIKSSEIMDANTSAKVGKSAGAQVIINGEVIYADSQRSSYESPEKECISEIEGEKGCLKYRYFSILCKTIKVDMSVSMNIVNTQTASVIYDDIINKEYFEDSCKVTGEPNQVSNNNFVPPAAFIFQKLTAELTNEFVSKLAPGYVYFNTVLLDSIELESVTDEQKTAFEKALVYGKDDNMDKAEIILTKLNKELGEKSYVVTYTLGLVKEAQGDFDQSKIMYDTADKLSMNSIDEIKSAVERINNSIERRKN